MVSPSNTGNINSTRPEIQGLAPYIEVFDMPSSLQFYRDVIGFNVIESSAKVMTLIGCYSNWITPNLC
jgi:hypothetical protein